MKRALLRKYNGVKHVVFIDPTGGGVIGLPIEPGRSPFAKDTDRWTWDGDEENPTIRPSMRSSTDHFYVTSGNVKFCPDAPHHNRGRTVPLEPIDEDFVGSLGLGAET